MRKITSRILIALLAVAACIAFAACGGAKNYKINVPSSVKGGSVTTLTTEVKSGESAVISVTPNEGYELDWLKINGESVTLTGTTYIIENVNADQEITVAFKAGIYSLNFSVLGDTTVIPAKSVTYDSPIGALTDASAPKGYTFDGWYTQQYGQGNLLTAETVWKNTDDVTCYAAFTAKTPTVNFDYNGGTGATQSKTVSFDQPVGVLPDAENTDNAQEFLGWYTVDGKAVTAATVVDFEENVTLKAWWRKVTVTAVPEQITKGLIDNDGSFTFEISVEINGVPVTSPAISLEAENNYLTVNGLTVTVAENAEGEENLTLKLDGRILDVYVINVRDYSGYTKISSADGLTSMARNGKYLLTADIDFNGAQITRIDDFDGILDGNGHSISGFSLNGGIWNGSMILRLNATGIIRNIAFKGITNPAVNSYGVGIVSINNGTVENCFAEVIFTAGSAVAGNADVNNGALCGQTGTGKVINCIVKIIADGDIANAGAIGYLVGNAGLIENVHVINAGASDLPVLAAKNPAISADNVKNTNAYKTTYALVDSGSLDGFGNDWSVDGGAVKFYENVVLEKTPEWGVIVKKTEYALNLNHPSLTSEQVIALEVYHNGTLVTDYVKSFKTNGESIVTVNTDGKLTAVSAGNTTVEITVAGIKKTVNVNVTAWEQIDTAEKLKAIDGKNGNYVLMNDIDYSAGAKIMSFDGVLDGNGHKIEKLALIHQWNSSFIENLNSSGVLRNIAFTEVTVAAHAAVSVGIISINKGTVDNCFAEVSFTSGTETAGGDISCTNGVFAALADGAKIKNCIAKVATTIDRTVCGSIIGYRGAWSVDVSNCFAVVTGGTVPTVATAHKAIGDTSFPTAGNYANTQALLEAQDLGTFNSFWSISNGKIFFNNVEVL